MKRWRNWTFLIFSQLCSFSHSIAQAADAPLPRTMGAIGDSITAGAAAQLTTQSWMRPQDILAFYYRLLKVKFDGYPDAAQRKDLSWSTGLNRKLWVHSNFAFLSYLAQQENQRVAVYNAAVSREDSQDAVGQLNNIFQWSETTQDQAAPDYLTVFIGANDLCQNKGVPSTPVETYRRRINKIVHETLVRNSKSKVLLIELPNINRVWISAHEKRLSRYKKFQSCAMLWRNANLCQNVLGEDVTSAERAHAEHINREYNRVLNETVSHFAAQSGRYGKDRVRISKGLYDQKLNFDDMSLDCFHLNFRGQSNLGVQSFYQSWWAPRFLKAYEGYLPWVKLVQYKKIR